MRRLVSCIGAIALVAVLIGIAVYFVSGGASPQKKMMKNHPYVFLTEKDVGNEKKDSYVEGKGCVYLAYPKTKNSETDAAIAAFLAEAKEAFKLYLAEEHDGIPRLVFDYSTEQAERYDAVSCFYEIALLNEDGKPSATQRAERAFYLGEGYAMLGLDGVLGENSEKKINLMLKKDGLKTADMKDFAVSGDTLTLRWESEEKELSVSAVERAGLIDPTKPMIALTFDDGPGKYSREFADLLAKYNGHGTFFVLGINVPNFDESLKYVYEMGNEIASHTYSHKNLNIQSAETVRSEIEKADQAIYDAIGVYPTLIRAPYGNAKKSVVQIADRPIIKWNLDTEDWKSRNAEAVKKELLDHVADGDIILMHEIYKSTYDGLALALDELSEQGYQFVTVSELMHYRGIKPEAQTYFSFPPNE